MGQVAVLNFPRVKGSLLYRHLFRWLRKLLGRLSGFSPGVSRQSVKSRDDSAQYWSSHGPTPFFRENVASVRNGVVPNRYLRVSLAVRMQTIIEVGSGEGLVCIALRDRHLVVGIDASRARTVIAEGILSELYPEARGTVKFVSGDATSLLYHLLSAIEDEVGIVINRTLYHLGKDIVRLGDLLRRSPQVREIVLVGNREKTHTSHDEHPLGEFIEFAKISGMSSFLSSSGFSPSVFESGDLGDPIVVGTRVP